MSRLFAVLFALIFITSPSFANNIYNNLYSNDFLKISFNYKKSAKNIELNFAKKTSDTSVNLPISKDKQEINITNFGIEASVKLYEGIYGFADIGMVELNGKYYDLGDSAGFLNFDSNKTFTWGIGLDAEMVRFKNGMILRGKIKFSGWKSNIQYGSLKDLHYGGWVFMEQKFFLNRPPYAQPNNSYYLKPYIGIGYTKDDYTGELFSSNFLLISSTGHSVNNASIKTGIEFGLPNLFITLEGNFIDEKSFSLSAGTSF